MSWVDEVEDIINKESTKRIITPNFVAAVAIVVSLVLLYFKKDAWLWVLISGLALSVILHYSQKKKYLSERKETMTKTSPETVLKKQILYPHTACSSCNCAEPAKDRSACSCVTPPFPNTPCTSCAYQGAMSPRECQYPTRSEPSMNVWLPDTQCNCGGGYGCGAFGSTKCDPKCTGGCYMPNNPYTDPNWDMNFLYDKPFIPHNINATVFYERLGYPKGSVQLGDNGNLYEVLSPDVSENPSMCYNPRSGGTSRENALQKQSEGMSYLYTDATGSVNRVDAAIPRSWCDGRSANYQAQAKMYSTADYEPATTIGGTKQQQYTDTMLQSARYNDAIVRRNSGYVPPESNDPSGMLVPLSQPPIAGPRVCDQFMSAEDRFTADQTLYRNDMIRQMIRRNNTLNRRPPMLPKNQ